MLGIVHQCKSSAPQIDYTSRFEEISRYMAQILTEVSNHNQSVSIDWQPILHKMQVLNSALENIRSQAVTIGSQQVAAAETLNSSFLGLARQVSDFSSASLEASSALLRAEVDQTIVLGEIRELLKPKPVIRHRRYTAHYRASATGGLITIPTGTYSLQVNPLGCYVYTANGAPQEPGHVILQGDRPGHLNHKWDLELPPGATVRLDYDAPEDFQPPEVANVSRLTLADLTAGDAGDDQVLANAIAAAEATMQSESAS